jgi:hypothetical protein
MDVELKGKRYKKDGKNTTSQVGIGDLISGKTSRIMDTPSNDNQRVSQDSYDDYDDMAA